MTNMNFVCSTAVVLALSETATVSAAVVQYHNKALWQAAVSNNYHTVDFTGFAPSTIITTQYQNVGLTFTDGNDYITNLSAFVNDGWGLAGNILIDDHITVRFAAPQLCWP